MAKVQITIDDTNPELVALFGENSLDYIAAKMSYPPVVPKAESELPAMVEVEQTNPITGDVEVVMAYPAGTVLDKPNDEPKAAFVGRVMLTKVIVPKLLEGWAADRKAAALAAVQEEMKVAAGVLERVAVISVE